MFAPQLRLSDTLKDNAPMILHITSRAEWEAAQRQGVYAADSLAAEGFIHCSTPAQVLGPANAFFRGQAGLVLLQIDPSRLMSPLVYEDLYAGGQDFPHIYGPLNLDAVTGVVDFPPGPDGAFVLPAGISQKA
jgi:uncharacterized protein (DUF952 family)